MTRRPHRPDRFDEGGIIGGRAAPAPPPTADLPLFAPEPPAARVNDPETSKAAAEDNRPRRPSQRHAILLAFTGPAEGLTAREATAIGAPDALCGWKRVSELAALGYLADSGERRTDGSGSAQTVYELTPAGYAYARTLADGGTTR